MPHITKATAYKQVHWVRQQQWEYFSMDYLGCRKLPDLPPDVPLADIKLVEQICSDEDFRTRKNGCVVL